MAARGTTEPQAASARPNVGDILLVIHDFKARSSDELSLTKGDRVELIERDDEFGDGWFLGKHLVTGNSGLFPEVYTRPAPKGAPNASTTSPKVPMNLFKPVPTPPTESSKSEPGPAPPKKPDAAEVPKTTTTAPTPKATSSSPSIVSPKPVSISSMPFGSLKGPSPSSSSPALPNFSNNNKSLPSLISSGLKPETPRMASGQTDSYVLNETLNVIDEHITETLRSTPNNNNGHNDSGSEYSSHLDHRMSYIQGEETDEEEENLHTRPEVQGWSADQVAEYLFTAGVEKHHCEVFRDQEITGEVLLGMDQTSIFIKAFDLGSVGRRLKTWQKIKALQDEVNGLGPRRTTQTYGSDVGSMDGGRGSRSRSRTNTLTGTGPPRLPAIDSHSASLVQGGKRSSVTQTQFEPVSPVSPVSPSRPHHEQRPSAASVRDLHHSRRHSSSTDFRITGTTIHTPTATPRLPFGGTNPQPDAVTSHRKQPSFDRNWTLGGATSASNSGPHTTGPRPLSSAGFPQDFLAVSDPDRDSLDLDRGYFSSTDVDGRKRNVLKKRDSVTAHSRTGSKGISYADEQRVRSATALTRHSRAFGSIDSTRDQPISPAAQKYYGMAAIPHRRTASTNTTDSSIRPTLPLKDAPPPTVTKLDGNDGVRPSPISPNSPAPAKQGIHVDWLSKPGLKNGPFGLRAISDAVTGHERSKIASPVDSPSKDSPVQSPTRTGSSTPSVGPSFDLDSPSAKSPSTAATAPATRMPKKKGKKETSAYLRGLAKVTPREAMADADYSGWMKKKSSNLMTTWKPRLFVLKGRRLAYYYSEDDDQEKGLIDISFHRVLPADNERLTGLHATLTGASTTPTIPAGSQMQTLAATDAERDVTEEADTIFIFKLVPPRAGLSRAVNFTKPMVHYFAVPNVKQGRLWMAALMKATIDRDDMQPITTSYQHETISLSKAQKMRHRPPALMNLDEKLSEVGSMMSAEIGEGDDESSTKNGITKDADTIGGGLGIVFDENDSGVSGLVDKLGLQKVESARSRQFPFDTKESNLPQSA
ncbi:hypothetical protein MAPG_05744 [Magnaporthiopsis poae ATCC 64411]|uniref:Polarized growth protein Boi2 n=1 Tax=Magnaporthiopsis poae (strain ATCC 64411 / 73-15) TaxID=644358 RepID=A0A0C4E076_MAGP6|nr:hypothetical protein MAPG_05744 [Magnaporthiopsis poae ATCC 64411]